MLGYTWYNIEFWTDSAIFHGSIHATSNMKTDANLTVRDTLFCNTIYPAPSGGDSFDTTQLLNSIKTKNIVSPSSLDIWVADSSNHHALIHNLFAMDSSQLRIIPSEIKMTRGVNQLIIADSFRIGATKYKAPSSTFKRDFANGSLLNGLIDFTAIGSKKYSMIGYFSNDFKTQRGIKIEENGIEILHQSPAFNTGDFKIIRKWGSKRNQKLYFNHSGIHLQNIDATGSVNASISIDTNGIMTIDADSMNISTGTNNRIIVSDKQTQILKVITDSIYNSSTIHIGNAEIDSNLMVKATIINGGVTSYDTLVTLTDSTAIYYLPKGTGAVDILIDSLGIRVSHAEIYFSNNGSVFLKDNGAYVGSTNIDNQYCIYNTGAIVGIRNRRAGSKNFQISVKYH